MLNGTTDQIVYNETLIPESFDFITYPNLVNVTIACGITCIWFLIITFYNSQLLGFILTKVISKFYVTDGYIYIGSFSVSLLSGKIMFKNVQYVTKDYSFQIVDGLAIFKWWLKYDLNDLAYYRNLKKDNKDVDLSRARNCRLVLYLNGLEFHLYNRSERYKNIQDMLKCERYGDAGTSALSADNVNATTEHSETTESTTFSVWRELFPLVQMKIRSGKLAVGNRLLETTLWVHFNSGDAAYSFPDASSDLDNFTHYFKCNCSDVRMLLSNSPGYKGAKSEPPSFMGDGFPVLQSTKATVTYFQDDPGVVPPDFDVSSMSDPEWGLDVKFQKSATIRYGPWVDQQRFVIQKYFFPNNFQELPVTKPAEREELRVHSGFDVNIEFPKGTTFDMLFTKNEETSAIHIICDDTATFHYYQPWIVNEYGYSNNIIAHFQKIEISSSMTFQKLIQCEVAEINLNMTVPRMWNSFQRLNCEIWLTKTTCYYINDQQDFFNDLSKDWSSKEPPDIAKFLPYEWEFHLYIRDFELILLANQFNWIDCTNENENNQLALCGETLDISFNLSFTEFLPETVETKFFFRGETVILRSFLPVSNTLRRSVISLSHSSDRQMYPKFSYVASTDTCFDVVDPGNENQKQAAENGISSDEQLSKGWRQRTGETDHWVDVWSVPVLILNLYYKYHPQHFENEDIANINRRCGLDYTTLDPNKLESDVLTVELEAGPSAVRIFGAFWRQFFIGIKNNYFGSCDHMYEFNAFKTKKDAKARRPYSNISSTSKDKNQKDLNEFRKEDVRPKDMRRYRRFEANITLVLLEIQAELSMHTCNELPSPHVYSDRITFEMHKTYKETRLQLILSPISIVVQDALKRASDQSHLSKGFLTLSGLQFRGHAMFSDKDIPLGAPTVEYAWLMELQCAKLTGKITPLQLQLLLLWMDTFLLHIKDEENVTINPDPTVKCPHNQNQVECTHITKGKKICPSEEDLKYRMFRLSLEAVDVYISEVECACNIQAAPIRFSRCNSTSHDALEGGSFFINEISIRQFVQQLNFGLDDAAFPQYIHSNSWVEVGVIALGPITADMKELGKDSIHLCNQVTFLRLHDKYTKRLWFLWSVDMLKNKLAIDRSRGKICGCVGGCNFFDTNTNGVRFFTNQSLDAANEKYSHYGSESLWGGQTGVGSSVKELINKMSDGASTSMSNLGSHLGSNPGRRHKKTASSTEKTLASRTDTPDMFDGSAAFMMATGSKASKLACDRSRSRSLMGRTVSQGSLHKRTESDDGTFYSCESECELPFRSRSLRAGSARRPSLPKQHSIKSCGSSISYVSAMTEILDGDDVDGSFHCNGPLVPPGLLLAYTHYMQPVTCINWRQNIPSNFRRKFSLMKNLKFICPVGSHSNLPSMPSFNPNVHGKLPFIIVSKNQAADDRQNKVSNSTIDNASTLKEVKEKKSLVNVKLHQTVSLVLTPLLVQALDRYISCLSSVESNFHVLHTLDSLHAACINKSKNQYIDNSIIDHLTNGSEETEDLGAKMMEVAPISLMTFGLDLPEINLIFLQISSETYIPSEQSSLSGQCGSEYSDCDLKNTDCVLMAVKFSSLSLSLHESLQNSNLFNSSVVVSQKYQSMNIADSFLNKCKEIITTPSITVFTGDLKCLQTQVLYLEGNNDRQVNVTGIPISNVQFHVVQGGDLNFDASSIIDSGNKDILGTNIIFEGGINGITLHGVFQKKINEALIKVDSDKCNNNFQKNDDNYVKVVEKPDHAVVEVLDEEVKSDPRSDEEEPVSRKSNEIVTEFDSESSIGSSIASIGSTSHIASTRKGYISLDVDYRGVADTSDVDADDENEEEDGHVSINTTSPKDAVKFSKNTSSKKQKEVEKTVKVEAVVLKVMKGDLTLKAVWINLAAPTHLRNIYHEEVQNLNLVTVLVPALSCWIPPIVDFLSTMHTCKSNHTTWMRSVLACFMGQGLPELLVKKHNISCAVSEISQFLQEEYSSQLIYVMRRQSDGNRLLSIKKSLMKASYSPKSEDLLAGIHALARQWKCMIIGAEVPENAFGTKERGSKKPVVGRGKLTEKDFNIIKQNFEPQSTLSDNPSVESPVEVVISDDLDLSPTSEIENHESPLSSETNPLLPHSISEEDGNPRKSRVDVEVGESLYQWMSKSPPSTAINSPLKDTPEENTPEKDVDEINLSGEAKQEVEEDLSSEKLDTTQQLDMLRSTSPMVSVPTSGVQLAKAAVVFNAIFSAVGIKSGPSTPYQISNRGAFCLEKFQINLLNSEITEKEEDAVDGEQTLPAFLLENLQITLTGKGGREQIINYASSMETVDLITNDIKFFVDIKEIHQHLDFKFVRLLLQITETMHVVKEQKKFAQKNKESVCTDKGHAEWDKVNIDMSSGIEEMPKSWRNMYKVMNLYKINIEEDLSARDVTSQLSPSSLLKRPNFIPKIGNSARMQAKSMSKELCTSSPKTCSFNNIVPTLSLTGTACLRKAKLTASISGLDLDFEMKHLSTTYMKDRKKVHGEEREYAGFDIMSSLSIHMNKLTICLLESIKGTKTMMSCKVTKSHALHTTMSKPSSKLSQRSLLAIGPILIEIPQHPGALRNILAQFTARLQTHYMEFDGYRVSRSTDNELIDLTSLGVGSHKESNSSTTTNSMFRVTSRTIQVTAALLPSLNAEYKIDKVTGWGSVNGKVKFFFHLPSHVLSFNTTVHVVPLPATTHISLPPIKVDGNYFEIHTERASLTPNPSVRGHSYLPIQVNIGPLVHNLSTDLLNHLVFLQKGFAKEVNEVVQDVDTNEPIPLWKTKSGDEMVSSQPMIYSIKLKIQSICITATTPSSTGVRLETGEILFELSNQNPTSSVLTSPHYPSSKMYGRAKVDLNLSLGQFNKVQYPASDQDLSVFANFRTSLGMRNAAHENRFDTDNKETIFISLEKPQLFVMPAAVDKGVLVYLHYKNAYDQWVEQRSTLSTEYSTVAEHILNRFPPASSTENMSSYLFLQVNIDNMGIGLPLRETAALPTTTLAHGLADVEPGTALLITIAETAITCCNSGSFVSTGLFKTFCIRFAENFDHMAENWCLDIGDNYNTYVIPEGSYEVCSRTINSQRSERSAGGTVPGKWVMTFFWKMRGIDVNIDINIGKRLSLLTNVLTAITGDSDVADLSSVAEAEGVLDGEKEMKYKDMDDEDDDEDDDDVYDQDTYYQDNHDVHGNDWPTDKLQESNFSLQKQLSFHTRKVDELRRSNASPEMIGKEVKSLQEVETLYKNQFFKDVKKKFRQRSTKAKGNANLRRKSNSGIKEKRNSLYLPSDTLQVANMDYFESDINYDRGYDTLDAPRIPDTVIYNLNTSGNVKRERPHMDSDTKTSTEEVAGMSHVKFSDSTYDVRSDGCANVSQQQPVRATTALDFELNVVADIDLGKCTFHTAESETKEEEFSQFNITKDPDRRHRPARTALSLGGEDTVILIPGVNVRVHYLSTNLLDKITGETYDSESAENSSVRSSNVSKQQVKTADLNALILIQSISKEMVVRPSLLDFLERALEPIMEDVDNDSETRSTPGTGSMLSSSGSSLYSFPVNVSVLIRVDPSDIRFSCLPVSKVECLLRIPSLDFAITQTHAPYIMPIVPSPRKRSLMGTKDSSVTNPGSSASTDSDIFSGFSFTLCLSRFSFCIFHPYGAQYGSTTDCRLNTKSMFVDQKKEVKRSSLPISGRKDSLSLNVEFIKFNLFRKTLKVPLEQISSSSNNSQEFRTEVGVSAICDIGSASFSYDMRRLNEILDFPKAWYKRGLVQRIFLGQEGSYATQTSISQANRSQFSEPTIKEGFILPADRAHSELQLHHSLKQYLPPKKSPGLTSHRRAVSGGTSFFSSLMSPFPIPRASTAGSRKDMFAQSHEAVRVRSTSDFNFSPSTTDSTPEPESLISQSSLCNEWETNVVVAFKVSRVDVSTNMGNVMGQAVWSTNDLHANCNVLLNNTGKRTGNFDISVRQSSMEAHGGVIGIYAELHDIKSDTSLEENLGSLPEHYAVVSMKNVELRLDYMGSSIIMATLSMLRLRIEDGWIMPDLSKSEESSNASSKSDFSNGINKCEINITCDASWDELQLIISRSTTPDIVKIISKLEDFFDQQHRNSIRALSTFRKMNKSPDYMSGTLTSPPKIEETTEKKEEKDNGLKYQHWMEILNGIYGIKFKNIASALPEKNIVLGGKLCLHGNFVSLTCFHGVNFRSQNWGLFNLKGPCIEFTTDNRAFEKSCQVMRGKSVQNLTVSLGGSSDHSLSERRKSVSNMHDFMATVRRVSRGSRNPPSLGAHVQEWMMFVNTISENDMPSGTSTNRQTTNEKFSHTKVTSSIRKVSFAPKFRYENESEVIFALPGLSLKLTTEHDLPMTRMIAKYLRKEEQKSLNFVLKPSNHTVDITFISDFDDSLTVNVSLIIYLHDLVLNYMKEKEASVTVSSSRTPRQKTSETTAPPTVSPKAEIPKKEPAKKSDIMKRTDSIKKEEKYREFRTQQWKLEPKVSVLTWGSRMDPINIEWVLEKLGFMHAALTIPKWMQRGVLDPMDVVLAKLVGHVLAHMVEKDEDKNG